MNVCFVNMPLEYYSPESGGAVATVTTELAAELEAMGHAVQIVSYTDGKRVHPAGTLIDLGPLPRLAKPLRAIDRVTRRLRQRPFPAYEQYLRRVRRALRTLQPVPDVVIVHNDFAAPAPIRQVVPSARIVTWLHNELPNHRAGELDSPDAVVTVSDYIRDRAVAGGVRPDKAHTILNGVNLTMFRPSDGPAREVPRVLCAGRLDPNKGFHVGLRALAAARDAGCAFETTLAGARWWYGAGEPSEYEAGLMKSVAQLDGKYVGLVPRDEIGELFRAHDIAFVLSISQDPCPLVVLEAMASGCAVIASPRGGIPQVAGGAAVLVDPDNPSAVAEATARLLRDPVELRRHRDLALAHAATASWRVRAQAFLDLVQSLDAA